MCTGNTYARCNFCSSDFNISHGGQNDVRVNGKHHKEMAKACSSSLPVASFFKPPQLQQNVIEAESLWSQFVAKHNLSFQSSDHATKLFFIACFQILT